MLLECNCHDFSPGVAVTITVNINLLNNLEVFQIKTKLK